MINRNGITGHQPKAACKLYVLDPDGRLPRRVGRHGHAGTCRVHAGRDVARRFVTGERHAVWVAFDAAPFSVLASEGVKPSGDRRLLVLEPIPAVTQHVLSTWFRYVVAGASGITLLPLDELIEVLTAPHRDELFIGGAVDPQEQAVVLYRGTIEPLVVPLAWFTTRPGGPRPDPTRFGISDYGQTIQLGTYEAAADAILYEFDPEYRRKARARAIDKDTTLGGSIRRLRLQKGVSRSDFPGVPERTVARIERNEVRRPHRRTLERIARKLGVRVDELETF